MTDKSPADIMKDLQTLARRAGGTFIPNLNNPFWETGYTDPPTPPASANILNQDLFGKQIEEATTESDLNQIRMQLQSLSGSIGAKSMMNYLARIEQRRPQVRETEAKNGRRKELTEILEKAFAQAKINHTGVGLDPELAAEIWKDFPDLARKYEVMSDQNNQFLEQVRKLEEQKRKQQEELMKQPFYQCLAAAGDNEWEKFKCGVSEGFSWAPRAATDAAGDTAKNIIHKGKDVLDDATSSIFDSILKNPYLLGLALLMGYKLLKDVAS